MVERTELRTKQNTWSKKENHVKPFKEQVSKKWIDPVLGTAGGDGPIPQPGTYNPLETSPFWELADVTASAWYVEDGVTSCSGGGAAQTALAFNGLTGITDGFAQFRFLTLCTGSGSTSFMGSVRTATHDNFVGIRAYQGIMDVYQRIGGNFVRLDQGDIPQVVGQTYRLEVVGASVQVIVGEDIYACNDTTLLNPGAIGMVPRSDVDTYNPRFDQFHGGAL